jgi:hypothetical protein
MFNIRWFCLLYSLLSHLNKFSNCTCYSGGVPGGGTSGSVGTPKRELIPGDSERRSGAFRSGGSIYVPLPHNEHILVSTHNTSNYAM